MFEGLGLGSRLAFLQLPEGYGWVPFTGALVYSIMTPLGIAIGLGVREGLVRFSSLAANPTFFSLGLTFPHFLCDRIEHGSRRSCYRFWCT